MTAPPTLRRRPDAPDRPVLDVEPAAIVHPGLLARNPTTNLFGPKKAGTPVVRADDLLALRIELVNLTVVGTDRPKLKRAGNGPARIILHLPPQSIAEEAVYQSAGTMQADIEGNPAKERAPGAPPPTETIPKPPLRARIAGESRLSFVVPDTADWTIDYRLDALLKECSALSLDVVATARERSTQVFAGPFVDWLAESAKYLKQLTPTQRARLSTQALRTARIAAHESRAGAPTLRLRAGIAGALVAGIRPDGDTVALVAGHSMLDVTRAVVDLQIGRDQLHRPIRRGPKPSMPSLRQTAIELPWRLLISPHGKARWQHAAASVASPMTQRTELWHTRLTTLDRQHVPIDYPDKDPNRTIRAVWALTGEGSDPETFNRNYPLGAPAASTTIPFLAALDDSDRFEFVHLSSNFSLSKYRPEVVDVNALMLTSLGGWMDSRGAWSPPAGFAVEEWVHRAAMGRDHYVRVVRKGFLFPFGHRVSLVKVTERKFHPTEAGNAAVLRQRTFIIVREPARTYTSTNLSKAVNGSPVFYHLQFPFSSVRILTTVTPDLDDPRGGLSKIADRPPLLSFQMKMFYPHSGGSPFLFRCAATDLDGRNIEFDLPMIFIENSLAARPKPNLDIDYGNSKKYFDAARDEWLSAGRSHYRRARLRSQRVALAASVRPGDTVCEVDTMEFGAETDNLIAFAKLNGGIQCYPSVATIDARIPALSVLSGSPGLNTLKFEAEYLGKGFGLANPGEVFMDLAAAGSRAGLDFSRQGDRSGGFVMPNLMPTGLSRVAGPISGKVGSFANGTPDPEDFFKELSPLLFGVIPLGEVIASMTAAAGSPSMPSFVADAATKVESFINDLVRLLDLLRRLPDEAGRIGQAGAEVVSKTLEDLVSQALSQLDTTKVPIAQYKQRIEQTRSEVDAFIAWLKAQELGGANVALNDAGTLSAKIAPVLARLSALQTGVPAGIPSGFLQSATNIAQRGETLLNALNTATTLIAAGKQVMTALEDVVGDPNATLGIFSGDANQLLAKLTAVKTSVDALGPLLAGDALIDGAPKQTIRSVIDALGEVFGVALASIAKLQELFGGEEMVVRFDWKPVLSNWALPKGDPVNKPLFRANDVHGFIVAVEARVKRNGTGTPRINVVCSLKEFDLILINPAGFMELNFEKIEFKADASMKMNVDVLLTDIKFIGVLSFVETLRDLIPLDGFSDPPHLDITAQGIDAGFNVALPNVAVGLFSLTNLSLGAGFSVPFIGQPLSVRFNFCTREQPFNLTVALFGGGGFFGITVDPGGVQLLEAAFEFGASISVNFGVASGGVHVMAGIYFRMEKDEAQLAGYFRLGGYVSVLGLVSASLELYLELRYEFPTGKAAGKAQLTIEISILMFSTSVTITCERKFAGSNGDPSFAQLVGPEPTEVLSDALFYPWREYCEAFA